MRRKTETVKIFSMIQERDIDRTVGINTGHVGTSDFVLEPQDREFVVQVCLPFVICNIFYAYSCRFVCPFIRPSVCHKP